MNTEGVGQCVISYDHLLGQVKCGMTFFQCGRSPVVIFTDLGRPTSITNSIESAANHCFAMHFLHVKPEDIMFFEHYRRDNGQDSFFQVKMSFDRLTDRYGPAEFMAVSSDSLMHMLSCYGHNKGNMPNLSFRPAKVIQFPISNSRT